MRLRKYGVEATIDLSVYGITGVDLKTDWVPAAADCEIMKDGGASTQCTNTATDEGSTYSIVLTATEMQAARLVLKIVDAVTKVFLDTIVIIETYGNASAQHAFDFDTASVAQSADNDTKISTLITGVDLNADAIKAVSYDESTAFPLAAVNGSTLTEAGGTGDHLTAINLPNQTMDIVGDITGNLSGSVGSVTTDVTTDAASRTASQATGFATPTNITAGTITTVSGNVDGTVAGKTPAEVSDLGTVQTDDHTAEIAKIPKSDSTVTWNATALASINTEVDTSFNTAIPSTPTADSINEYIQIMKYVMLNKTTVTKATGTSVILKDNDSTIYATVVGAYVEDPTTVVRLRLE